VIDVYKGYQSYMEDDLFSLVPFKLVLITISNDFKDHKKKDLTLTNHCKQDSLSIKEMLT